jgi:hypothetical protein
VVVTSEFDDGLDPEFRLTVRRLNVDMETLFFAGKEEESEGTIPKDRWAHADDDGKCDGVLLVANPFVSCESVPTGKRSSRVADSVRGSEAVLERRAALVPHQVQQQRLAAADLKHSRIATAPLRLPLA